MKSLFLLAVVFLALPVVDCGDDDTVLLAVPWLSQQPDEYSSTLDCGPTALLMADAYINGSSPPVYADIQAETAWMEDSIEGYDQGELTNIDQLAITAEEYFGIPAESFFSPHGDGEGSLTLEQLKALLQEGLPVVIATQWQGDNNTDEMVDGAGHFMLLVGMTSTHVVMNDPGPWDEGLGKDHYYTLESFEKHWQLYAGVQFFP